MSDNSKQWKLVINLVDIIALGIQMAPTVYSAYTKARGKIQQIVDEGREPTLEEHEELNKLINDLRGELHKPIEAPEA